MALHDGAAWYCSPAWVRIFLRLSPVHCSKHCAMNHADSSFLSASSRPAAFSRSWESSADSMSFRICAIFSSHSCRSGGGAGGQRRQHSEAASSMRSIALPGSRLSVGQVLPDVAASLPGEEHVLGYRGRDDRGLAVMLMCHRISEIGDRRHGAGPTPPSPW